jgi:hypothetical protein
MAPIKIIKAFGLNYIELEDSTQAGDNDIIVMKIDDISFKKPLIMDSNGNLIYNSGKLDELRKAQVANLNSSIFNKARKANDNSNILEDGSYFVVKVGDENYNNYLNQLPVPRRIPVENRSRSTRKLRFLSKLGLRSRLGGTRKKNNKKSKRKGKDKSKSKRKTKRKAYVTRRVRV